MSFGQIVESIFVVTGLAQLCAAVLLTADLHLGGRVRPAAVVVDPLLCFAAGGGVAVLVGLDARLVLVVAASGAVTASAIAMLATDFRPAGVLLWFTVLTATSAAVPMVIVYLQDRSTLGLSTQVLLWAGLVLGVLRTPIGLMQTYEGWELGLRHRLRTTREALEGWVPPADARMVTVQVPIHAEPPEVVVATLDALARLDYPNFEVMVIDNNTTDERLWRPVEEHCERLGRRFRFFHVEGIAGAKAGALNWARPSIDPRTTLLAIVDADYQVHPRWLADTVGFFEDPDLGFVQSPHAYRDYEHSLWGRMLNAGYAWAMRTEMVSRNEHGAGLTVGTMSVIRLAALDVCGGWAEWCQTEDSELAIRVHAAGYTSIVLRRSYGWGLAPGTLLEFKKQRFRWTYGPGQEFRGNVRRYLPRSLGGVPSALDWRQRVRHGFYGLYVFAAGLGVLNVPISLGLLVSLVSHNETPALDPILLVPIAAMLCARRVLRWLIYRKIVGVSFAEFLGGTTALLALGPTVTLAAFSLMIGRPSTWWRTSKFRSSPAGLRQLRDATLEIVLGLACLAGAVATPLLLPAGTVTVVLMMILLWQAITYGAAPLLAIVAEHDLGVSPLPAAPPTAKETDGELGRPIGSAAADSPTR